MARILITTWGSLGDLFPYLALGRELQRRGHAVTLATSALYRGRVDAAGLRFHAVRPDVDPANRAMLAYVMDARHGSERVLRLLAALVRESYEDTLVAAREADAVVTHPIAFGAVMVAEKLSLPWISTVLAPISMLSSYDPPVTPQAPWLHGLRVLGPGFMTRFWRLGKWITRDWMKPVLELRRELGLDARAHPLFEGSHSPRKVLALFSHHLAEPQPDWPPNTAVTGFPFYDTGEAPPELARFFAEGPAPVVFTLGSSAVGTAGSFYVESLAAVQRIGCRAVFLTGAHPQGLPERLPAGVLQVEYAPHAAVFARASAIVHQGGIGTTAQAMRSGHPELVIPFGHDQFDNGARVKRLGAAQVVYRSRYKAQRVARALRELMREPRYGEAAANLGRKIGAEDGASVAADEVECSLSGRPPTVL